FKLPVAQAKSPCFPVVGGSVRNPIRRFRQAEQVGPQFGKRHCSMHWDAVVQHMQVMPLEVDNSLASAILDIGVCDVPFFRNAPVENLGTARDLAQLQWDRGLKQPQALPHSLTSNATTDRIQRPDDRVGFRTLFASVNVLK